MIASLVWPRCVCGHMAQDHNKTLTPTSDDTDSYGCDMCKCPSYRFPPKTSKAMKEAILERQRKANEEKRNEKE
jgi:hypothetical protein